MRKVNVLDKGYVELIGTTQDLEEEDNCQPLDYLIARAARVSYQKDTKTIRDDAQLIDYLMRHRHTSPFEMIEFTFRVKAPLFVVQQWLRHRTASINQESARYSVLEEEFYYPTHWRLQSSHNKQGSEGVLDLELEQLADDTLAYSNEVAYKAYKDLLEAGVAREQARMVLPVNIYTSFIWKIDLHNLLHFLNLRLDEHAQWEIRQYAQAVLELIEPLVPCTLSSWYNHVLAARSFSNDEFSLLAHAMSLLEDVDSTKLTKTCGILSELGLSNSRIREFLAKFNVQLTATQVQEAINNWNQN